MFDCNNLIHPFQNDPGVSQQQRVMDDLLHNSPKIDGRSMADLLHYFVQLSPHVNYYDEGLGISDWQPFFQKSIPFVLAAIIKYDIKAVTEKTDSYNKIFNRHPSKAALQLQLHYIFQQVISRINAWHLQLQHSELPAGLIVEKLIKDKLREPLKKMICINNVAVKYYCIKPVSFSRIAENEVWGLDLTVENAKENCRPQGKSKRKRLIGLRDQLAGLLPSFLDAIRIIAGTAAQSMEQSLFPLKEELQKKHTPHLALLFAFLKLFQHLQGDLNTYTKKHLDFFYKQVLQLKARDAVPDKAHIVFEIQKQLDKYLLKKGLLVKDGKDNNKSEIRFALDDEIVVNKTQVADKRTLFLNNQNIFEHTYIEGVYMAPTAGKADGLIKDFKDTDPKSFATLGAKLSKYTDPEKTFARPYPNARIGFILASPVLLLNEGKRTIDITLACRLTNDYCNETANEETPATRNCCEETTQDIPGAAPRPKKKYPDFIHSPGFYSDIVAALNETYYYISEDLVADALKNGIGKALENKLRSFLIHDKKVCYCAEEIKQYDAVLKKAAWDIFYNAALPAEKAVLDKLFKPRKALKALFSGEKEWIEPTGALAITMSPALSAGKFLLHINAALTADQPAVTFYNKDELKEDFNTTLPLVKVELDDTIKLAFTDTELEEKIENTGSADPCCLLKASSSGSHTVSLYHFFRNVTVLDKLSNDPTDATRIDVSVCGLKNFIVQNDESVQDVNGLVYPFGTRPDIVDFSVVNPTVCITPAFINDATPVISVKARNYLQSLITPANGFKKVIAKNELELFLDIKDNSNNPVFNNADKIAIRALINDKTKSYCLHNQTGPNFYIGSGEVFCKKWNSVRINLNWKDKPNDFREYYNAYVVEDVNLQIFGLDQDNFKIKVSVLQNGSWVDEVLNRKLFDVVPPPAIPQLTPASPSPCTPDGFYSQGIVVKPSDFPGQFSREFTLPDAAETALKSDTRKGFIKINLQEQDFLHKDYPFILARQMMAMGKYPDSILEGAVYRKDGNTVIVFRSLGKAIVELKDEIFKSKDAAQLAKDIVDTLNTTFDSAIGFPPPPPVNSVSDAERDTLIPLVHGSKTLADNSLQKTADTKDKLAVLQTFLGIFDVFTGEIVKPLTVLIPNEPWTPIIKNISLDYTATATINDMDLIHLYPFDGTYKTEKITLQPTLFPTCCDEGNLFIGLKDLEPGSNVNVLFQLAEATADSESDIEEVNWYYLENNQWKTLRKGFEVQDDATDGLTTSGIVKFALPENMTKDNTVLPKELHWIKASVSKNSKTVCETMGIYTQAIRATFTNEEGNDKLRLSKSLAAGAISKLNEADANVKKLSQPFDSFGGRVPEAEGHFYVRISELLRHKGRAIQKFDYERLVLEAFPQLFKAKCINHSFALNAHEYKNDFPIAPGYVLLAVIPDLNQLKAAQSFEPRVPVSMLGDIQEYCKKRSSPFVRFRAMNPRYEKVHFCLKVKLIAGKDENYYKEKMKQDLREFLAPWAIGEYDKLRFGQCVGRSEVIRFLETRDYVDYIIDLLMRHDDDPWPDKTKKEELLRPVCPKTPRSILIAGDIDVCIPGKDCEEWGRCFDVQGQEVDCCDNKKIPVADYCKDDVVIG
ncbi:hypothetical protein [Agriterribacter sp.]|uniref:hypothetical protein n=1 Tax=Agriterribacter sp. TaxID=2821509 RepID=UPI002CB10254|nr:hypothetical protein [Agriterribacter sp.]HRO45270.1 hypothetical protein [Agriterribacter sp.]